MSKSTNGSGFSARMFGLGAGLWLAALAGSCGGISDTPKAGGESHFLDYCEGGCGDGLSCISGVCTRSCLLGEGGCTDLASGAQCTDQSIEPGAVAVCDVPCSLDAGCAALGPEHRCDEGYCRSGTRPEPSGASCRVAHRTFRSGTTDIPPPRGCGACTCLDGELTCTEAPCSERGAPLVLCPAEIVSDPFEVRSHAILGDSLVLDIAHGGGCARHDYALCFDPASRASLPPQFTVALIHDAHDDTCGAYLYQTLKFDLSRVAETHMQQNASDGGVVSTPYGLYTFGENSCEVRMQAATEQLSLAMARADKSCVTAADCASSRLERVCPPVCSVSVARTGFDDLLDDVEAIATGVCGDYVGAGCRGPISTPCEEPAPPQCVDGTCR